MNSIGFSFLGGDYMSAEVAATKAAVAVASDKRGRIAIATILCLVRLVEDKISVDKLLL